MAKAYLSATPPYVVVVKGDTLSEIAEKYASHIAGTGIYGSGGKLATLVKINDITNADRIVVGQKIQLSGSSTAKKNNTSKAVIKAFGLQSNTDRTMYATWTWSKSNTENYRVIWQYDTGDGVWFEGNDSTTDDKQSIYSAPQNADRVRFKVLPISKKRKVNNKETSYWTASWSTIQTYAFKSNPPTEPSGLTAEIKDLTLTVTLDNLDVNATSIEFQVVRNNSTVYKTGKASIKTGHASFSCTVASGSEYKVRCRAVRGKLYSDWTDYSDNMKTIPAAPSTITDCAAETETAVHLEWTEVKSAESYSIEYATEKKYFDQSDQTTKLDNVTASPFWSIYNLETGKEYFFRVRAENAEGSSEWSPIVSVILGTAPSAPTTWSSTTTAIVGEDLTLYWIHNSEDGSDPTWAKIELNITTLSDSGEELTYTDILEIDYGTENVTEEESSGFLDTVANLFSSGKSEKEDEEDGPSSYTIQTANFPEGATIEWTVKTKGVTAAYSTASMARTVNIYAQPTLSLGLTNKEGVLFEIFESFPLYVKAEPGPRTQRPIGYYLSVISNDIYETVDNLGNSQTVNVGDEIYSKYFEYDDILEVELSANNVNLDNNISYTLKCVVSMNSGLVAEAEYPFTVAWEDEQFEPNAEIFIDEEHVSASIRPFCEDENGEPITDVLLSVYRREFNGSFTELAKDIANTSYTFITDPHPALDFARYRIVAKTIATGGISYYDVPGYPVNEKGIILQWDEAWSNFNIANENLTTDDIASEFAEPTWSGSLLRLPYNVDVSDSYKQDSVLVEYIGRKHPVSYYGTQISETSTWSVEIPKGDKETLYALRRLAVWMGDVYVREPSGSGYWANVTVSFSQTHCEVTIPVTLNITRVEGGV